MIVVSTVVTFFSSIHSYDVILLHWFFLVVKYFDSTWFSESNGFVSRDALELLLFPGVRVVKLVCVGVVADQCACVNGCVNILAWFSNYMYMYDIIITTLFSCETFFHEKFSLVFFTESLDISGNRYSYKINSFNNWD